MPWKGCFGGGTPPLGGYPSFEGVGGQFSAFGDRDLYALEGGVGGGLRGAFSALGDRDLLIRNEQRHAYPSVAVRLPTFHMNPSG